MKTHIIRTKYKNLLESYNFKIQNFLPTRVPTKSKTCIDHVITSFLIETQTTPLTTSDHYAVEPIIPFLPGLTKNHCLYYPKRKNLNKLKGNHYLNFIFLLNHYLGLKPQISSIDEDTTYILGTIYKRAENYATEEYIKPTKVKNTWINKRLKNHLTKRNQLLQ